LLAQYIAARAPAMIDRVRRHAVITAAGLAGAALGGSYLPYETPHHQLRVFHRADEAYAWLGAAELGTEVDALVASAQEPDLLRHLREYLDRYLIGVTIGHAAKALGLSTRSLQRELGSHGTAFRTELDRARVRAAVPLLATDDKLETIARRVGCASASHLVVVFQRVTGKSPGEYRRSPVARP
jgi:AraC-like DNA-binding protein